MRRALSLDELRRLLESTQQQPKRFNMSGSERAMVYRLAAETGLRANEIRSLKVSDFDLVGLVVQVAAASTKNKKVAVLPLRPNTVEILKGFFSSKLPTAQAFKMPCKAAAMLKADLAATEQKDESGAVIVKAIPYVDDAGRKVDFHSLRHTAGTLLAASGVHPKVAQSLMRHSDINLTMSLYIHTLIGQEVQAIAALPDLSLPSEHDTKTKAS